MSATGSLSPEQKATLESVFLLLRTTRPLLSLICSKSQNSTDRFQLDGTIRLMEHGQERLAAAFPELGPFAEQWKQRGGL